MRDLWFCAGITFCAAAMETSAYFGIPEISPSGASVASLWLAAASLILFAWNTK